MSAGHLDNREAQRQLRERERLAEQQAREDMGAVLALPAGRRFFWALLQRCQVFGSQLSGDAMQAAHFEGRRSLGVSLMVDAQEQHAPLYVRMVQEALEAAQEDVMQRQAAEAAPNPEASASIEGNDAG